MPTDRGSERGGPGMGWSARRRRPGQRRAPARTVHAHASIRRAHIRVLLTILDSYLVYWTPISYIGLLFSE